jgi:PAS domain S-box-containing protein
MTKSRSHPPAGSPPGPDAVGASGAIATTGEIALQASEQRFRHLVETVNVVPYTWDVDAWRYLYVGPQSARIFGYPPERWTGQAFWLSILHPDDKDAAVQHSSGFNVEPRDEYFEYRIVAADGRIVWVRDIIKIDTDATGQQVGYGMMFDITEAKQRDALLQQAQKMEAVGQLTGGIAHDFNNLLTVIVGSIELVADQVQGELRRRLDYALQAAERGATLVQGLLAFSRRLSLRIETVDFNQVAAGMGELLRRTLGRDVEVEMKLDPSLWSVLTDRGQIEGALLNLAINARDAMPEGGKLTIETANVRLGEDATVREVEAPAGDYVMLAVTDTGTGMSPAVVERATEPFFTTKEVGKGTGLGLSMIYGFAKQSRGHLTIHSELGHGTSVRLYLPRQVADKAAITPLQPEPAERSRAAETVLVVEDDPLVRSFVVLQLHALGYRVIEAADGPQAQRLLETEAPIDLLFTDVFMPGGLNGRELAAEARRHRPTLKTLYTSGYAQNIIMNQGRLEPGAHFLPKPYKRHDLAIKVREALDAAA